MALPYTAHIQPSVDSESYKTIVQRHVTPNFPLRDASWHIVHSTGRLDHLRGGYLIGTDRFGSVSDLAKISGIAPMWAPGGCIQGIELAIYFHATRSLNGWRWESPAHQVSRLAIPDHLCQPHLCQVQIITRQTIPILADGEIQTEELSSATTFDAYGFVRGKQSFYFHSQRPDEVMNDIIADLGLTSE